MALPDIWQRRDLVLAALKEFTDKVKALGARATVHLVWDMEEPAEPRHPRSGRERKG